MKEIRLTIHANIPQEAIDTWHYGDIVSFIKTQLYEAVDNAVKDGLAKELLEAAGVDLADRKDSTAYPPKEKTAF